jgi:sialic acid synthase SpsE
MRQLFTKSVVARVDLPAGTVLGPEHLSFKKPGTGIPSERVGSVLGRALRRDVARDQLLTWEDLDGGA